MVETSNQFALTMVFIFVLLGLVGGLFYLQKKYPEETLGEIISIIFQRQVWTIQVITILIIGVAEAGMAASFHITGQAETNPLIRFTSHLIIAITYTAAQLALAPAIVKMFKSFTEGSYVKASGHVVQVGMTSLIAFGLPIANLALIANGVGETDKLEIFFYWLRVDNTEFAQFLVLNGLPTTYKAFGNISYVLATSAVLTLIVHPILGISDSILTITQGGIRSQQLLKNTVVKEKELSKDDKKNLKKDVVEKQKDQEDPIEKKKKTNDDFISNVEYLLTRMGYDRAKQSQIFETQVKRIQTVLDSVKDEKEKGTYGEMVSKFRSRYIEMEKSNASKEAIHKLDMEVFTQFQKSPKQGGFGTSIKRPVPPAKN